MPLAIDADFPGGNIIVESIDGDVVTLRQDPRDTPIWWFYWACRVRGTAGRTVTFCFTDGDVFAAMGPCFSVDGESWRWLGRDFLNENAFTVAFTAGQDAAFLAFCIPYQPERLSAFLASRPFVEQAVLCISEGGRPVPHLVCRSATGAQQAVFTARHHACESMANYEIEGLLDFWASDEPEAAFLRAQVDFHLIPFMDIDGVARGDQGKCREPHDHNRDYTEAPLYAAVRALMAQAPAWRGARRLMLDLHCPWIRGDSNEELLLVEPDGVDRAAQDRFIDLLHGAQTGPVVFDRHTVLRFGEEWNQDDHTSTDYFRNTLGVDAVFVIEFPYARYNGQPVSAESARQFGFDLGRTVGRYLQT